MAAATGWQVRMGLVLAAPAVLVQLAGSDVAVALRFERTAILDGELWRLFTAHFVHLGWPHLLLNLAGLLLILSLAVRPAPARMAWVLVGLALGVATGLLLRHPELEWYVGLSGVLHGLMAIVAWGEWRQRGGWGLALAFALVAKLAWEQWGGAAAWSTALAAPVIVDAHLYGAVAGLCLLWITVTRRLTLPQFPDGEPAHKPSIAQQLRGRRRIQGRGRRSTRISSSSLTAPRGSQPRRR